MALLEKLQGDMVRAMKAGDKPLLGVLRMLVSELKYKLIDKAEITAEDEVKFLMSEAKKRRDSIEAYRSASPERAQAEEGELRIIESYLPAQMSDEDLNTIVSSVLAANPGLDKGPLMGKVMAEIKARGGVVDGARVKSVVDGL